MSPLDKQLFKWGSNVCLYLLLTWICKLNVGPQSRSLLKLLNFGEKLYIKWHLELQIPQNKRLTYNLG